MNIRISIETEPPGYGGPADARLVVKLTESTEMGTQELSSDSISLAEILGYLEQTKKEQE